jgi:hypothetical protein
MEAVLPDGDSRQERGPDAVLEQQLRTGGRAHAPRDISLAMAGSFPLVRPALEQVGIGGVEAEQDDGTDGAISVHEVGMQWARQARV